MVCLRAVLADGFPMRIAKSEVGLSPVHMFPTEQRRRGSDNSLRSRLAMAMRFKRENQHVQDSDRCRRTGSRLVDLSNSGRYDAVAYVKTLGGLFNLVESRHQHLSPREDTHVPCPVERGLHSGGILISRDTMCEDGHLGKFGASGTRRPAGGLAARIGCSPTGERQCGR
jgi:hypothetical protein